MLEKIQNLTNPITSWKTKTYKEKLLGKDADNIVNLFDNTEELQQYLKENELPQQKEALRALYYGLIDRMKVDKKFKNQVNDFIKSERELLKNERFAENLLNLVRKNELKKLAYALKKELGFQKEVENLLKRYQVKREEYSFLYQTLLEILPEKEAKVLNQNRDMLTIRKDSSILWKEFSYLFDEKKKTYLLKEIKKVQHDYDQLVALEKNVQNEKKRTTERIQKLTKELEKMEKQQNKTVSASSTKQQKKQETQSEKIEQVYKEISKKPAKETPAPPKKEEKRVRKQEKAQQPQPKVVEQPKVTTSIPKTTNLTPNQTQQEHSKKDVQKTVVTPIKKEKQVNEQPNPIVKEINPPTNEEMTYVETGIPDFNELGNPNGDFGMPSEFNLETYENEEQNGYGMSHAGGIPSMDEIEGDNQNSEMNELNTEEASKEKILNEKEKNPLNEPEDNDRDLMERIWNDKN